MQIKSVAQKDTYEIFDGISHIKITKSDGKEWYLPIEDLRKISAILELKVMIKEMSEKLERISKL